MHVMIFGCGYSGTAIAKAFTGDGVRVFRHDAIA